MDRLLRRLFFSLPVLTLILTLLAAPGGSAILAAPDAAGDLDTSFGNAGKLLYRTIDYTSTYSGGFVAQPDGKVILAGYDGVLLLARFDTSGQPDPGFGGDGKVTLDITADTPSLMRMALQSDGKLIVTLVSRPYLGPAEIIVVRLQQNGSRDTTFGVNGQAAISAGNNNDIFSAPAVTVDSTDRIVIGGAEREGNDVFTFVLYRLTANGSIDNSFSGDGKQTVSFPALPYSVATALAIQSDGKIVVAGSAQPTRSMVPSSMAVARLNSDGTLDSGFGSGGASVISFIGSASVTAIALGPDGKIVLAGQAFGADGTYIGADFALARFLPDGAVDSSFGSGGKVRTDISRDEEVATGVVVLPDNTIIAAGRSLQGGGDAQFTLVFYKADGALDSRFGNGGKLYTHASALTGSPLGMARLADGTLLLGGPVLIGQPDRINTMGAVRFAADGQLDLTYGQGGLATALFKAYTQPMINDATVQPDGAIVVAGSPYPGAGHSLLARFTADGRPDSAFGQDGLTIIRPGLNAEIAYAVALQTDGKIVAAGTGSPANSYNSNMLAQRVDSTGAVDTSFGTGGYMMIPFPNGYSQAKALAIAPDGKIVLVGLLSTIRDYAMGITRLNADGSIDRSFGIDGRLSARVVSDSSAAAVAIAADGKILVAGTQDNTDGDSGEFLPGNFALLRLNDSGTLDHTFGDNGKARFAYANTKGMLSSMALLPDGKILLAGWMQVGDGPAQLVFVRANADGSPDSNFGNAGHVITALGVGTDNSVDMTVQADGKIVVTTNGVGAFGVARFNPDGSPDAAFGANGVVTTSFAPDVAQSSAVVIQPGGRIVVAGDLPRLPTANNGNGIALAAYRATGIEPTSTPTPAPLPPSPTPPPGCIFGDVCGPDYFFTPVQYLVNQGAISGYGDNTFRPFNSTTRSQLVKIVVIASGLKLVTPSQPTFNDIAPGDPFYRYVETAAANGFIAGYADGTFRPYNTVTRGQLSKIIVLARRWTPLQTATPSFSDVPGASPFYGYVERAHERGIISGYGDGAFRPGANATRSQVAKIVYLALQAGK